jgi:predicted glycoside hydrolase/deacetylase ChbG (UPF0249 family)
MKKTSTTIVLVILGLTLGGRPMAAESFSEGSLKLLIRTDDVGMSHTVNLAVRKFIETGVPFSASVMIACPWYLEAAEILRDNPQVSVGIHLMLNSEWEHYKWGPVLGRSKVPSLVDENGHFFATAAELMANGMELGEVELELRAQIERAKRAGLDIDYFDYHMGTAVSTPELTDIVEKLADEYGVGLSRYFGEPSASLWAVEPDKKLSSLLGVVGQAKAGRPTLVVIHLGLETPEMSALVDVNNPDDPYRVAKHRQAELDALTSPAFRRAVAERGIEFVTYRDMVEQYEIESMKRPGSTGYSMEETEE